MTANTVCLESAIRLRDLGFPQHSTAFKFFHREVPGTSGTDFWFTALSSQDYMGCKKPEHVVAAPTAEEITKHMGGELCVDRRDGRWTAYLLGQGNAEWHECLAEALAQLYIKVRAGVLLV